MLPPVLSEAPVVTAHLLAGRRSDQKKSKSGRMSSLRPLTPLVFTPGPHFSSESSVSGRALVHGRGAALS